MKNKSRVTTPAKKAKNKRGRGRPTKWTPLIEKQIIMLAKEGWVDTKIGKFVDISIFTLHYWKKKNPEFSKAIKEGKSQADELVTLALYQLAIGYDSVEEKIFYNSQGKIIGSVEVKKYRPPNARACIFWLCNRHPDRWKRNGPVQQNTGEGGRTTEEWCKIGCEVAKAIDLKTDGKQKA